MAYYQILLLQSMYWEWKQYMESCVLLLQVAANIFTNITSELVLQEVLNSAQGYNFLCRRYSSSIISISFYISLQKMLLHVFL